MHYLDTRMIIIIIEACANGSFSDCSCQLVIMHGWIKDCQYILQMQQLEFISHHQRMSFALGSMGMAGVYAYIILYADSPAVLKLACASYNYTDLKHEGRCNFSTNGARKKFKCKLGVIDINYVP